jgi:predicted alpha/beta superfamily hydrolase
MSALASRRAAPTIGSFLALLLAANPLCAQGAASGAAAPPADAIPRHRTITIDSRAVGERRVINVYTPPEYETSPRAAFPVLYMPDGGMAEDFPHVANTIDSLITAGEIAPVIVVGIENTQRRRDLTGPTAVATDSAIAPRVGGSAAFRRFIRDELMPKIRAEYRCTAETAIVGESLAGLFVVETFLLEPALFGRYIAIDPSLWWNGGELVRTSESRLAGLRGLERTLYLTASSQPEISTATATLSVTLRAAAPAGLTLYRVPRPDLDHGTIFRGTEAEAYAKALW